jgi:RecB family exonuclease
MTTEDVMRRVGRQLTATEQAALDEIKKLGNELHAILHTLGTSREVSLAKTKLEEAVMWASKHITR